MDFFERIKKVIIQELGTPEERITMEASFRDDIGASSVQIFDLIHSSEDNGIGSSQSGKRLPERPGREQPAVPPGIRRVYSNDVQISFYATVLESIVQDQGVASEIPDGFQAGIDPIFSHNNGNNRKTTG